MDFSGGTRRSRRLQVELNVTSFVDIIFNLLVFFILSTSFTTGATSAGLVVDLPAAASADQQVRERDVVVAMTTDGLIVVRGAAVAADALPALLEEWRKDNPTGWVIVQADAAVPHGRVVEVMDRVKSVGIARVLIAAQAQ
ncbi:MAG: biopolymer transporter ExbD [Deltaproteobacteria bacterium]|nr:biopolymer transporter ExbD [Deltaproteobacteria bacterium]